MADKTRGGVHEVHASLLRGGGFRGGSLDISSPASGGSCNAVAFFGLVVKALFEVWARAPLRFHFRQRALISFSVCPEVLALRFA